MWFANRWVVFLSVALLGTITDLVTKHLAFNMDTDVIADVLRFKFVLNKGIIWGLFSQGSFLFLVIPALAVPLIILMFKYISLFTSDKKIPANPDDPVIQDNNPAARPNNKVMVMLSIAFGLILAGAAGNLYDRIVYEAVRDFIDFYIINWPIFNLADTFITIGAIIIIISTFIKRPASRALETISSDTGAGQIKEEGNAL